MNELALFAGAGGGILGGHLLGWRTVCAVEWEPYAASVLVQRQNDGILPPFPIWDDVQTFDGKPWRGIVDVVSGGFPCQDISIAGKGDGLDGQRSSMWQYMARVVSEVRPRFVFVENSPMLTIRGGQESLQTLPRSGMTQDGLLWEQTTLEPVIAEKGFGYWPTPTATDWKATGKLETLKRQGDRNEAGHQNRPQYQYARKFNMKMPLVASEILMMWPLEWTDLKPLEMDRFQEWQQQHGSY